MINETECNKVKHDGNNSGNDSRTISTYVLEVISNHYGIEQISQIPINKIRS